MRNTLPSFASFPAALVGLLISLGQPGALAQTPAPASIAIISTADTADLAALLTTELSHSPDVSLVERDELAKAGDEFKLQQLAHRDAVALGKLVGADGVIFLSKSPDGLQVRFTASGLGYALFDDRFDAASDVPHLAATIAQRVTGYAPKLKLPPREAILLSLLNLRADVAGVDSVNIERNLSLLLESRLAAVPRYVILERRHASAIKFETSLTDSPAAPLPGVSVIDGTLSLPTGEQDTIIVHLRLRPSGGVAVPLEVRGSIKNLPALAEAIVAAIGPRIGVTPQSTAWQTKSEAREYLREGIWASQHNANEAALEALDSAELLGENPADVIAVRIPVLCGVAVGSSRIFMTDETTPNDPHPEARVEAMLRAFHDEARYVKEDLASQLQFFHPNPGTMADTRIREEMLVRAAASLLKMLDAAHSPHAEEVRSAFRSFVGYDPLHGKLPADLTVSIRYADALSLSMEEEKAYYRPFFEAPAGSFGWSQLQGSIYGDTFCARFIPNRFDRYAAYREYLGSLLQGPGKLTALLDLTSGWAPGPTLDNACLAFYQALVAQRDSLPETGQLAPFLSAAFGLERLRGRSEADPQLLALEHFALQHAARIDGKLAETWHPEFFPATEAPALWKDFLNLEAKAPGDPNIVAQMRKSYLDRFGDAGSSAGSLEVTRFWSPPNASGPPQFANYPIFSVPDGIWIGANFGWKETSKSYLYHIAFNPSRPDPFTTEIVPLPEINAQAIAATRSALYVIGSLPPDYQKSLLVRIDLATRQREKHELPSSKRIFEAGGAIYLNLMGHGLTEMEGGIIRLDDKTCAATILASSRRRPPQNQFDDREAYTVQTVFAGPSGQPCASIGFGEIYAIGEKPGQWPLVLPSGSLFFSQTLGSRTLLYGQRYARGEKNPGDVVFMVDSTKATPELWLGASAPLLGTEHTSQVETLPPQPEWTKNPLWPNPPPDDTTQRTYGFRGDELFAFVIHPTTQQKELLWYRRGRSAPLHLPLNFKMTEAAATALKANEAADQDPLKKLRPPDNTPLQMYCAPQGLCFLAYKKGFWFLPFADIDAILKAAPH